MMSQELKPEKVKIYLKLLTEACLQNQNKGLLRKEIWQFLWSKYGDSIDYRDFLLAIRRFLQEGKVINNDGVFEMDPQVIHEVREKTPTPALKAKVSDGKVSDSDLYYKLLNGKLDDGQTASTKKKRGNQYLLDSKISDSGKKQKVKRATDNTTQSTIEKYYIKRHANNSKDFLEMEELGAGQAKPLGFATPAFDMKVMNGEVEQDEESYENETPTKTQKEFVSRRMSNLQKQKKRQAKSEAKRQQIEQQMQQVNKKIQKGKKGQEQGIKKNHHDKKNSKQQQNQQAQENEQKITQKELLDKTLLQEAEKLKQRQRAEKDERKRQLKETKEKVLENKKQKLTSSVIKALKQAFQSKNLQNRKQHHAVAQAQKSQLGKMKKTKAIKKTSALKRIISDQKNKIKAKRALKQKFQNWEPKLMTNRLRGKTLDLTELGIIKKKKDVVSLSRQSTLRLDKPDEREQRAASASRQLSRRSSVQRQVPKNKAIKKSDKKQKQKVHKEAPKQRGPKRTYVKKVKPQVVERELRVDHDRKAKIDAVKNLRQLYSKDKLKHALYIDEKLIYL